MDGRLCDPVVKGLRRDGCGIWGAAGGGGAFVYVFRFRLGAQGTIPGRHLV